mgnify:CR=1 FL=1|jgi:hypothetical protein
MIQMKSIKQKFKIEDLRNLIFENDIIHDALIVEKKSSPRRSGQLHLHPQITENIN